MIGFLIGCAIAAGFFYVVGIIGDAQERRHDRTIRGHLIRHIGDDE